jgi:hypothetical protein
MPLPTRYRIYFGEPLRFDGDADDEDSIIEEKVHKVRDTIQEMLRNGLEQREAVFW